MAKAPIKKVCERGHVFYKSSDCPVCPTCEKQKSREVGDLPKTSAPAGRALEHAGITTLSQLARITKAELLKLHGMGPKAVLILENALNQRGLSFKK